MGNMGSADGPLWTPDVVRKPWFTHTLPKGEGYWLSSDFHRGAHP